MEEPYTNLKPCTPQTQGSHPPIALALDNLRSAYNVGAIFRTADAVGIDHIYLYGITPTPENPKVAKTALSAEYAVPWSHHRNGPDHLATIHPHFHLLGMEGGPGSCSIFEIPPTQEKRPLLLIMGSEFAGIDPALLRLCEALLYIPMLGFKRSLNVASAFSIAAYCLRYNLRSHSHHPN